MATYVISDIHGQLDKFKEMLDVIDFKFDGSDELHILGDMIDWGKQSLGTLLYCKALSEKYSSIYIYKGNHEQMMLDNLMREHTDLIICGSFLKVYNEFIIRKRIVTGEWYYRNGGYMTYDAFSKLDNAAREDIIKFLKKSAYFNDKININGQKFYLVHAAPYNHRLYKEPQMYKQYQEYRNRLHFLIWHRFEELEESFVDEKYKDYILIHGHTPTMVRNGEGLNVINRTRNRICIDTGAKMMCKHKYYPQCRLSCLRLDDMAEFYVS